MVRSSPPFPHLWGDTKRNNKGSLKTTAQWIRNFVRSHPAYKFDSRINEEINYDLIKTIDRIEKGELEVRGLLPDGYRGSEQLEGGRGSFRDCCEDVLGGI